MSDTDTTPLFTPFTWLYNRESNHTEAFVSDVMDISNGLTVILQVLEQDGLAMCNDEAPFFDIVARANLRRLAIVNARLLGERAESEITRINDKMRA